ncbi:zeta toxin family protein [Streptomyces sp. H39-C1]|uniref:zeta toxin family protein n=1 Tax=Streptomyces sp. H39-C1 TaxID=3004355 RepID=UPI0022AE5BB4|nr:zeta toxin family protein [Streptomyces sp. H39-C1]MCZ4101075.1 zeta toxin family protein [Streptomyces sp. H39-C1]
MAVVLPDEEHRHILTTVILPTWAKDAAPQKRPVAVFVAGPPGSGKTEVADLVHEALSRRGGAVRISSDLYKTCHPGYAALLVTDDRKAGIAVRPDTRRWQAEVELHARQNRFDVVVETALADPPEAFRATALTYRQAGYRIEVAVVATAEAWSLLGAVDRYLHEGRYVSWENLRGCSHRMLDTLATIDAEHLADRMTVLRRGAELLYANELIDGAWTGQARSAQTVAAEQGRPWQASETARFRHSLSSTEQRLHDEQVPQGRRLVVRADTERAFALAEPVRRIAQPTAQPPGIDYHRLSADEHQWIFDELIVPTLLPDITAQEQPIATYVMGQPGASKTQAANLVQRAMRGRPTRITGDSFKAMHPDYYQLLIDQPRNAGAAIRADYRAWVAEAEAYVRSRRGDVIIELAPGHADDLLQGAAAFHAAGYRVDLVVLAVRAADSRQATAHRYAAAQQIGVSTRFTSAAGHDTCFAAVTAAVRGAENHPAISSMLVLSRDGQTLTHLDQTITDPGAAVATGTAARALAAEQRRLYTGPEAARFLTRQRALHAALPQHRTELPAIAALARPLFPDHLLPRRISLSRSVPALPACRMARAY